SLVLKFSCPNSFSSSISLPASGYKPMLWIVALNSALTSFQTASPNWDFTYVLISRKSGFATFRMMIFRLILPCPFLQRRSGHQCNCLPGTLFGQEQSSEAVQAVPVVFHTG